MTVSILHETEHPTISLFNVCMSSGSNPLFFAWISCHIENEQNIEKYQKQEIAIKGINRNKGTQTAILNIILQKK